MAIDKVREFALAFPHNREDQVLSCLFGAGMVHLTSYTPSDDSQSDTAALSSLDICRLEREQSLSHVAEELELASATLSFFAEVKPVTKGLVLSFFPDEVYVNVADMSKTASMASSNGYTDMMRSVLALKVQLAEQRHRVDQLEQDRATILPWVVTASGFRRGCQVATDCAYCRYHIVVGHGASFQASFGSWHFRCS